MKEWTRAERYRQLQKQDTAELQVLHQQIAQSLWRGCYHVQPVTGLLNDPNGFSYWRGKWHLFYQYFPFGPVHGLKYWYLVESDDLLHWQNEGIRLYPDKDYDNRGCYSGSAYFEDDQKLYLAYTGNHRTPDWIRHPYQIVAEMKPDGTIIKPDKPTILPKDGYTEHQRDPKLFRYDDHYDILVGAQRNDGTGALLLYRSDKIEGPWKFHKELTIDGWNKDTFMLECPDLEKIGGKWILLFSPQGMKAEGTRFQNKYNNTYLIGRFDEENAVFYPEGDLKELDEGFDFYAAQCAYQNTMKDAAVLEGWVGCGDMVYPPSDEEGWSGMLSLARKLTIEDGKLKQRPAADLSQLKDKCIFKAEKGEIKHDEMLGMMPSACVIEVGNPDDADVKLNLFSTTMTRGLEISYSSRKKELVLDRGTLHNPINPDFGTTRTVILEKGLDQLQVFMDGSTAEVFVNDGETVMTCRLFPEKDENLFRICGKNIDAAVYAAKRTVQDDFRM